MLFVAAKDIDPGMNVDFGILPVPADHPVQDNEISLRNHMNGHELGSCIARPVTRLCHASNTFPALRDADSMLGVGLRYPLIEKGIAFAHQPHLEQGNHGFFVFRKLRPVSLAQQAPVHIPDNCHHCFLPHYLTAMCRKG